MNLQFSCHKNCNQTETLQLKISINIEKNRNPRQPRFSPKKIKTRIQPPEAHRIAACYSSACTTKPQKPIAAPKKNEQEKTEILARPSDRNQII